MCVCVCVCVCVWREKMKFMFFFVSLLNQILSKKHLLTILGERKKERKPRTKA